MQQRTFSLAAVPPYRLDLTAWALRRRGDNAIDSWDGRGYRRVLELGGRPSRGRRQPRQRPPLPQIAVQLTGVELNRETEAAAEAALHRLLGLEARPLPLLQACSGRSLPRPAREALSRPQAATTSFVVRVSRQRDRLSAADAHGRHPVAQPTRGNLRHAGTRWRAAGVPAARAARRAFRGVAKAAWLQPCEGAEHRRARRRDRDGRVRRRRDRVARQRGGGRRAHASPRHRPLERRIRPPARPRPTQRLSRRRRRRPKQPRAPAQRKGPFDYAAVQAAVRRGSPSRVSPTSTCCSRTSPIEGCSLNQMLDSAELNPMDAAPRSCAPQERQEVDRRSPR